MRNRNHLTRAVAGAVTLVFSVVGCVSAPYRPSGVRVPAEFMTARDSGPALATGDSCATMRNDSSGARPPSLVRVSAAQAPAPIWRELGDSTLLGLIEDAERTNTDARIAASRLRSARAARRLATYDLAPTITGSGSASRQQLSSAQIPGLGRQLPPQEMWDAGFDASWELDLFGRVGRNVAAQSALVSSAEHGLDDVRVSIAAEVARTYFELRGAQRQLAVSQRTVENQRRTLRLTEDRLAAGRGTAFDTERARAALFLTQASIPSLESQIAQRRLRLGVLLGRAPDALPAALLDSGALPRLPDTLRVGTPAELVRRRPDVLAAERQLAARSLLVGSARASYLPRVTLAARAGYAATTFDSLGRTGTSRLLIGPVISWPMFDLGRVKERVNLARADEEAARAAHDATVLNALEEADAALVAYDRAHAGLAVLEQAAQSSARAADLAQQRFDAGLTDLLQVLDAQRTLLEAENALALGHTAAATALVAVYKAVGGTWPTEP